VSLYKRAMCIGRMSGSMASVTQVHGHRQPQARRTGRPKIQRRTELERQGIRQLAPEMPFGELIARFLAEGHNARTTSIAEGVVALL